MAKAVFHSNEIKPSAEKVFLDLPKKFAPVEPEEPEEVQAEPVYDGPTVEDLQREADAWREDFAREKEEKIAAANAEAEQIRQDAEKAAFEEVRRKTNESQAALQKAKDEAARIEAEAKDGAARIEAEARQAGETVRKEAYNAGFAEGREAGFQSGKEEADRLIGRLHAMLEGILNRRQEILNETEQQIVDLVLLMTRKVVKVLSESSRNVVAANIVQALRKVKNRGTVTVRVNLRDAEFVSAHIKEFLAAVENISGLSVAEDSSVDPGGCIVDTDFGSVDARIMSQLEELEQKILEISPLKSRARPVPAAEESGKPPHTPPAENHSSAVRAVPQDAAPVSGQETP